jgi:hypothetical protein
MRQYEAFSNLLNIWIHIAHVNNSIVKIEVKDNIGAHRLPNDTHHAFKMITNEVVDSIYEYHSYIYL